MFAIACVLVLLIPVAQWVGEALYYIPFPVAFLCGSMTLGAHIRLILLASTGIVASLLFGMLARFTVDVFNRNHEPDSSHGGRALLGMWLFSGLFIAGLFRAKSFRYFVPCVFFGVPLITNLTYNVDATGQYFDQVWPLIKPFLVGTGIAATVGLAFFPITAAYNIEGILLTAVCQTWNAVNTIAGQFIHLSWPTAYESTDASTAMRNAVDRMGQSICGATYELTYSRYCTKDFRTLQQTLTEIGQQLESMHIALGTAHTLPQGPQDAASAQALLTEVSLSASVDPTNQVVQFKARLRQALHLPARTRWQELDAVLHYPIRQARHTHPQLQTQMVELLNPAVQELRTLCEMILDYSLHQLVAGTNDLHDGSTMVAKTLSLVAPAVAIYHQSWVASQLGMAKTQQGRHLPQVILRLLAWLRRYWQSHSQRGHPITRSWTFWPSPSPNATEAVPLGATAEHPSHENEAASTSGMPLNAETLFRTHSYAQSCSSMDGLLLCHSPTGTTSAANAPAAHSYTHLPLHSFVDKVQQAIVRFDRLDLQALFSMCCLASRYDASPRNPPRFPLATRAGLPPDGMAGNTPRSPEDASLYQLVAIMHDDCFVVFSFLFCLRRVAVLLVNLLLETHTLQLAGAQMKRWRLVATSRPWFAAAHDSSFAQADYTPKRQPCLVWLFVRWKMDTMQSTDTSMASASTQDTIELAEAQPGVVIVSSHTAAMKIQWARLQALVYRALNLSVVIQDSAPIARADHDTYSPVAPSLTPASRSHSAPLPKTTLQGSSQAHQSPSTQSAPAYADVTCADLGTQPTSDYYTGPSERRALHQPRFGNRLTRRVIKIIRSHTFQFAFKFATLMTLLCFPAWFDSSMGFYQQHRLQWIPIIVLIVLSPTIGSTIRMSIYRTVGTLVAAAMSIVAWYITNGNAYGLAVVSITLAVPLFYVVIFTRHAKAGVMAMTLYTNTVFLVYLGTRKDSDLLVVVYTHLWTLMAAITVALVGNSWFWSQSARSEVRRLLASVADDVGLLILNNTHKALTHPLMNSENFYFRESLKANPPLMIDQQWYNHKVNRLDLSAPLLSHPLAEDGSLWLPEVYPSSHKASLCGLHPFVSQTVRHDAPPSFPPPMNYLKRCYHLNQEFRLRVRNDQTILYHARELLLDAYLEPGRTVKFSKTVYWHVIAKLLQIVSRLVSANLATNYISSSVHAVLVQPVHLRARVDMIEAILDNLNALSRTIRHRQPLPSHLPNMQALRHTLIQSIHNTIREQVHATSCSNAGVPGHHFHNANATSHLGHRSECLQPYGQSPSYFEDPGAWLHSQQIEESHSHALSTFYWYAYAAGLGNVVEELDQLITLAKGVFGEADLPAAET
ncbi:hypothetical protein H4R35_000620 [Dimargaris xerosporica]|nr:hypothetical protein H4R35_000620 [Dimargaris xerosporica]